LLNLVILNYYCYKSIATKLYKPESVISKDKGFTAYKLCFIQLVQ